MVFSKRELEGYVKIDHRESPGFTEEQTKKFYRSDIPIGSGMMFEGATNSCSHCQRIVVMNPDRTRQRGYCTKCDHYICDQCSLASLQPDYIHKSFRQVIDEFRENALKGALNGTPHYLY